MCVCVCVYVCMCVYVCVCVYECVWVMKEGVEAWCFPINSHPLVTSSERHQGVIGASVLVAPFVDISEYPR